MAKAPAGPRNLEDAVLAATEPMRVMHTLSGQAARAMAAQGPDQLRTEQEAGFYAPFQDFTAWHAERNPPPAYPMPPEYDDASLLVDCDRLAEIGSPLVEVLRRLPVPLTINPEKARQMGIDATSLSRMVRGVYHRLRCINGPENNALHMPGDAYHATMPATPAHHYVEHTATWNGLTLRWYEWEPRRQPSDGG